MGKREEYKDIEIKGRKWRIGKFDALTGSYILYKLMNTMLPMGLDATVTGGQADKLPQGRPEMTMQEFIEFQKLCLSVVSEITTAGGNEMPVPVLLANGAWGVKGLDHDTMTVIGLTIHALMFNVSGFFDENALKELKESILAISPFNA